MNEQKVVLVVDDDYTVVNSLSVLLRSEGYIVHPFVDPCAALETFRKKQVDVVLTDIFMPVMNGLQLLERIHDIDADLPVIFITGRAGLDMTLAAIHLKAFEFFIKPLDYCLLLAAVADAVRHRQHLLAEKEHRAELEKEVVTRTCQLSESLIVQKRMNYEVIERLAKAAELRDEDTGSHIRRVSHYANRLARFLGMPNAFVESITLASTMHDVGKIGISDEILFKQGSLSDREFETIKSHTLIGERMMDGSMNPVIQMAAVIAASHHERWDGTGYPRGLKGEEISLEGRIVMLADQYDALRSRRVYKEPYSHEMAVSTICEGNGKTRPEHFDPFVLNAFRQTKEQFRQIFDLLQDESVQSGFAWEEQSPTGCAQQWRDDETAVVNERVSCMSLPS